MTSIDELLARVRRRFAQLDPTSASRELAEGALLVDIRPLEQRRRDGEIPGALAIDRNVLEWRLDPQSEWRVPQVTGHAQRMVLFCTDGYASSLAVGTLLDLGLVNATDVAGGYRAWAAAGLPTTPAGGHSTA